MEAELEGFKWLQVAANQGPAIVATATVYFLGPGTAPQLCNLYVLESARRQGIATAITKAVSAHLKRPYCLHVVKDSEAHLLYDKLGFGSIGAVKEKENSVWMLSPAP